MMQRAITEHPEILDEEILPPVFVTSLPRTGSTKLHRMLAATGDFNGLPFWMSYNIAPFPDTEDTGGPDLRIAAAEEHLRWLDKRLGELDRELRDRLRASPLWRERDELLRSVPGVGPVVAVTVTRWSGWSYS